MTATVVLVTLVEAPASSASAQVTPVAKAPKIACPAERPDEAAALVTARMCGGEVKIAGLTNEYDEGWAQPNGQVRWKHHYRPVRIRQNNAWVPVDTTLVADADGTVRPKAAAVDLEFSGGGGTAPMVTLGEDGGTLKLGSPLGALPKPVLDGDTATYPEVLPGVDLQLRADVEGYAQVLVVKDREAAEHDELETLEFPVSQSGLTVSTDTAGNLKAAGKDGKARLVGNAPSMWDAPVQDTANGTPRAGGRTKTMPSRLSNSTLSVTPVQAMLDDPATVYPVYLDPGAQAARSAWTMIDSGNPNTSYWNSTQNARVGTNNGGTNKYRSFYNLNVGATPIAGKHIIASNFWITETGSASCTPRQVDLWSTTGVSSATTWNNPPTFSTLQSSQTVAKGFSASCPAGGVMFSATQVTQAAANNSWQNVTLGLRSPNETDNTYYKQFDNNPFLSITYTAYASISGRATTPYTECKTGSGRPYINTVTPALQVRVHDPEGASVRPEFEWSAVGGSAIGSVQTTPGKASGQAFTATVPAGGFVNGGSYSWRARGFDSTSWGPWTGGCEFTVDTTAPVTAPTVTSTAYPEGQWAGTAGTAGSFTFGASGTTDAAAYLYGLDENPATVVHASTLGGTASISLAPGAEGKHNLKVQTRDRAGNLSPVRTYTFYVGAGAVTAPIAGATTAGKVMLSGLGRSGTTGVTYQWRRGDVDAWAAIPAADVTSVAGGAIAWPVATTGSGGYSDLVWNVAQTLNDAEAGSEALNGPLQVRASFSGSGSGLSTGIPITLDRDRTLAAASEAGPGEVNLLTGNYLVGTTDASTVGGLALQRAFNTRAAGDLDPVFGPGWTASVKATGTGTYTKLTVTDSLVQIGLADGSTLGFTKKGVTSSGATYTPQVGAEDNTLVYTAAGDTYLLTQKSGDAVTFSNRASGIYMPTALQAAGAAAESKISWENVTIDGTPTIRPTQLLAALPAGVTSCTPMVRGCRALIFTYATVTTATSAAPGDYLGRLKQLSLTAWDPDLPTPAMRTVVLAQYTYDNSGRLQADWDPRLNYTSGGVTKHVATSYTYNTDGTLATLTPPGEEPWQFTYTTVPGDSGAGRLHKVSRSALSAGTAVQTIVYNMRISGSGAPVDMAPNINRWGQTVIPVDATAVYPPDIIPDGDPTTGVLPSNLEDKRFTVTYMDPNGRPINTMYPGGTVSATWYDKYGNTVRELDAGNLAEALWRSEWDTTEDEVAYAQRESTEYHYSADGRRLLEELEPERAVVLANGQSVRGRPHIVNEYDEDAPSGTTHDLVTTETKSLQHWGSGAAIEADKLVTSTKYDWTLGMPIESTVDPDGLALTSRTTYDSVTGQVASTTSPAGNAAGTTTATRRTVYYRAGTGSGYSECDNHAEWAGMSCRVFSAAQPSGTELPVTVTTYDLYGQARTIVEKNSATTLRTTTVDSDAAGRPADVTVTAAIGTPIERRRTVYDPATGQQTGQQTLNSAGAVTASITTHHDSLGRRTTYTDADGNTSTTTYDLLSRPATISDGKGTQTYTYSAGRLTQLVDSQAGTFTATYYNNGKIATENRPDGIAVNRYYNEAGQPTGVDYSTSCGTGTCWLYYDYAELDAHQRTRWSWSSFSNVGYAYDKAGRLVDADQIATDGCARRAYTFDRSTNRAHLASYAPAGDGNCQQDTASTRTWTYDQADRVTTPSHNIDTLGRTLTVPSADARTGTGDVHLTYYTNDMAATITNTGTQASYSLDVLTNRYRSYTVTSGNASATHVNHYSDDTDKPNWIAENGSYTRRITGPAGLAAFFKGADNIAEWQIANLHGDIVAASIDPSAGLAYTAVTDEYGKSVSGPSARYGYLGAEQRSSDNPSGLITMGSRVYNPTTGRFLSTDSVYGGNANAYEYATGDPVNKADVSGNASCWRTSTTVKKWYYWWGTWGGYNVNINFSCNFTHRDFGIIGRSGFAYLILGAIAAAFSGPAAPVLAGSLVVAGTVLGWMYFEYAHKCGSRSRGATYNMRFSMKQNRSRWVLAASGGFRSWYCN